MFEKDYKFDNLYENTIINSKQWASMSTIWMGYVAWWPLLHYYSGTLSSMSRHFNSNSSAIVHDDVTNHDDRPTMMTSSNENIFHVTGHLCGEFSGPRWILRTKGQWREALMFSLICAQISGWVNNGEAGDLRRNRAHYDVIVMTRREFDFNSLKHQEPVDGLQWPD